MFKLHKRVALAYLRQLNQSDSAKRRQARRKGWTEERGGKRIYEDDFVYVRMEDAEGYTRIRDRNVPPKDDFLDPELLADDIPELMDDYAEAEKDWEQWNRQGWWPRPVQVTKYQITVYYDPEGEIPTNKGKRRAYKWKGILPGIHDDKRAALNLINQVIEKIKNRRRPKWLQPL